MEYRRFGNTVILRVDPGEDIVGQLRIMAERERIVLAEVNGLGAVNDFTVGVFDTEEKKFRPNHFAGAYEVTSLHGTITTKDGQYYSHLHMSAADASGAVCGGHLTQARVSATAEIVVRVIDGRVERVFDERTGLNLLAF